MRKSLSLIFIIPIFCVMLYSASIPKDNITTVRDNVLLNYLDTGAENAVAAIYLDYRIFDTLLEGFLLLVSVIGISQFLRLEDIEKVHFDVTGEKAENSEFTTITLKLILPILFCFGVYIIIFGANSPGGGFQGGAVLATTVMLRYLIEFQREMNLNKLAFFEELLFVMFLTLVGLYFSFYSYFPNNIRAFYLLLCGVIIGLKVAVGISLIFLHFTGEIEHRTTGGKYD